MWHDRGLSIVYSATLGAWSYIMSISIFRLIDIKNGYYAMAIAVIVFIIFLLELHRHDRPTDRTRDQYSRIQDLLLTGEDAPYRMDEIRELQKSRDSLI